jgi:hypothetical protein
VQPLAKLGVRKIELGEFINLLQNNEFIPDPKSKKLLLN